METSRLAEFRKELTKMPQFHAFSALLCRNSTPYKRTHSYSAQTADHVLRDKSTRTWNIKANKNRGKIPAVLSSFGLVATVFRALDETIPSRAGELQRVVLRLRSCVKCGRKKVS